MSYTDENGRLIVVQEDGTEVPVYAKLSGGILHCMIRCTDEETFQQVGAQVGLLRQENPGSSYTDPETGLMYETPPSGHLIPAGTATVTHIGPHVITPAVLDEDGNEVTPAVLDNRYHVNFWVREDTGWEEWIVKWMAGTPGSPNADEDSIAIMGVELIDPLTVTTPHNVLL